MSSFKIKTSTNSYTIEDINFNIGPMKITCVADLYYGNVGNQWPSKIKSVSGFGYSCSEAHTRMLDNVQYVISEHEKTNTNVVDESFEKNNDEPREE